MIPYGKNTLKESNISNQSGSNELTSCNARKGRNPNSLYQRLFNKDINDASKSSKPATDEGIIDSRTLDNVSETSEEDSSESTRSSDAMHIKENLNYSKSKQKIVSQIRLFQNMLTEISSQDRKSFTFRVLPRVWKDSQMCDVFVSKPFESQTTFALNFDFINENDEQVTKEYYVNVKIDPEVSENAPSYPTIELNDMLMAQQKISKFSRITLTTKNTVVNFLEKIELIPTQSKISKQEIMEDFKRMLVKSSSVMPLLINQGQIFKLCGDAVFVTVKLYPETFRYCMCDAEILRENKIVLSEQNKDVQSIVKVANEISFPAMFSTAFEEDFVFIQTKELMNIVEECVTNITIKNCLNKKNQFRKLGNFLIYGRYLFYLLNSIESLTIFYTSEAFFFSFCVEIGYVKRAMKRLYKLTILLWSLKSKCSINYYYNNNNRKDLLSKPFFPFRALCSAI